MSELSNPVTERSRKAYSAALQVLAESGTQRNLAQILGVSEATVSRIKTEKLEEVITVLYHLGFKVVASHMKCYPTEYVQALHTMARMHMEEAKTLDWDI